MFDFKVFMTSNVKKRAELINKEVELQTCPDGMTKQLQLAFKRAKVINRIIEPYIEQKIILDENRARGSMLLKRNCSSAIDAIFNEFQPLAIEKMSSFKPLADELRASPKNIYEMVGATELAFANRVSRNISTTMGSLWEKIAILSPYAVNPEIEFGVKIVGVDLILKNATTKDIEYAQLKTQKNTLTGSQSGRVDSELSLHNNPIFCACFDTKPNWTYNTKKNIPKASGVEFWQRICIEYDWVIKSLEKLFLALEKSFIDMLRKG